MPAQSVKVSLEVPEGISSQSKDEAERRAREAAVLALWEAAEISTRQAAAELNLTYYDFLDLLAEKGIPVVQGPLDTEALEEARRKFAEEKR
jgi:predicted HTH domain antitoxin